MATRHFLTLLDLSQAELKALLKDAKEQKQASVQSESLPCANKTLGMIFEKSSTRTRVSFEAGMAQMGGHALFLSSRDTQLGRGEPVEDSARVLSSMLDIVMIRTFDHHIVESFAQHSSVPVINGLTNDFHPCQLLADMQTYEEHRGSIAGKTVAWIGDGNNMCQSYIHAAKQFDFELKIACPSGYEPNEELLKSFNKHARTVSSAKEAALNADLLVTDVWASMGQEQEQKERIKAFQGYQINGDLLSHAHHDALYMHCLPAHRGEEISHELMDNPNTVIWDEAENRLHAQKALIQFLLNNS